MRDHKCEECSKGFFTRQELEAHERTHTGLKPYACEVSWDLNSILHALSTHLLMDPKSRSVKRTIQYHMNEKFEL